MTDKISYPKFFQVLHWLTLILIVFTVALVLIRDEIEGKTIRLALINNHRSVGVLILVLLIVRVIAKFVIRKKIPDHGLTPILDLAAKFHHLLMYLVLLSLPLLGWAQTSAAGKTVSIFGWINLPSIVKEDSDFSETLADYHQNAAWLLLALVLVHVIAALWHHFIRKDNVLKSMLGTSKTITKF